MSALLPPFRGVSERSERGVWTQCVGQVAHFNLTPKPLYVDGLICYHSCCQVLQLNLTARMCKSSHQHKGFWRQVEMLANLRLESVSALLPPF